MTRAADVVFLLYTVGCIAGTVASLIRSLAYMRLWRTDHGSAEHIVYNVRVARWGRAVSIATVSTLYVAVAGVFVGMILSVFFLAAAFLFAAAYAFRVRMRPCPLCPPASVLFEMLTDDERRVRRL